MIDEGFVCAAKTTPRFGFDAIKLLRLFNFIDVQEKLLEASFPTLLTVKPQIFVIAWQAEKPGPHSNRVLSREGRERNIAQKPIDVAQGASQFEPARFASSKDLDTVLDEATPKNVHSEAIPIGRGG